MSARVPLAARPSRHATVPADARVLAVLVLEGWMSVEDLGAYPTLADLTRHEIRLALADLIEDGLSTNARSLAWYRPGYKFLRRDVLVYAARGGKA